MRDLYSSHTGEHIATDSPAPWMGRAGTSAPEYNPQTHGCFWRGDFWEVVAAAPVAPSGEEKLAWWNDIRTQRDRVLPPVVDLGLTAKTFAASETDPDKKAELEALVIECIGADGFGGLAQELRDLPNNPVFKAAVESQPDFDAAKAYVLSWYQTKALAASPQLRARLKGAV